METSIPLTHTTDPLRTHSVGSGEAQGVFREQNQQKKMVAKQTAGGGWQLEGPSTGRWQEKQKDEEEKEEEEEAGNQKTGCTLSSCLTWTQILIRSFSDDSAWWREFQRNNNNHHQVSKLLPFFNHLRVQKSACVSESTRLNQIKFNGLGTLGQCNYAVYSCVCVCRSVRVNVCEGGVWLQCISVDVSCNCTNCAEEDKTKQKKIPQNKKCYNAIKTKRAGRLFTQGFNARRDCKKIKILLGGGGLYNIKKGKKKQKKTVSQCSHVVKTKIL